MKRLLCMILASACALAHGADALRSEVLARYPSGTYLENLIVDSSGAVLFTNYFATEVEVWRDGKASVFAKLATYPVNLVELPDGYLLLGHGAKFTDGRDALKGSNRLFWLTRDGEVRHSVALPKLIRGDGMILSGAGSVLIADSEAGLVWKVELASGSTELWFQDPRIAPDPARPSVPGANGLRRTRGALLITSSAARMVFRLPVDADDRPAGPLGVVSKVPGADDLAIANDGTIYVATHGKSVVRIRPGGRPRAVLTTKDVDGSTAVALSADGGTLYVLGTGGHLEGRYGQATLVRASVGR